MTTTSLCATPVRILAAIAAASVLLSIGCGGSTTTPTPTAAATPPGVSSVALNATNVAAGSSGQGTVSLTSAARCGGASISLTSSNAAVATVQTPVSIPAGSSSVTITVTAVSAGTATISATFNGSSSVSPMLTVTAVAPIVVPPAVATAIFGVTGPALTETCDLADNGATLNCTFDGSTSTSPGRIVAWEWTYGVAARFTRTTSGPVLTMPVVDCTIIPPPPMPAGNQWFTMTVTLRIRDDLGNISALTVDDGARLLPHGMCGF